MNEQNAAHVDELPRLPTAAVYIDSEGSAVSQVCHVPTRDIIMQPVYTAGQMRDYARAALEAARVAPVGDAEPDAATVDGLPELPEPERLLYSPRNGHVYGFTPGQMQAYARTAWSTSYQQGWDDALKYPGEEGDDE